MDVNNDNNLDVDVRYEVATDLITITFTQDDSLITVGFDIHEAQVLNLRLANAITTAILRNINPPPPETCH